MLKDVQAQKDERNIALKHVGIRNLRWPIVLADREKGTQPTVATVSLAVDLPREQRGTHMSRFVECLKQVGPIRPFELEQVLDGLKQKLEARKAMLQFDCPYFITKKAPVSGIESYLDVDCHFKAEKGETFSLEVGVDVPIHTCAPVPRKSAGTGPTTSGPGQGCASAAPDLYGSRNWWPWRRRGLPPRCIPC
jgi:GTP cyclohydrolase IB